MNVLPYPRWRKAIALGLLSLPAVATASEPETSATTPVDKTRTIEVLHGTRKVSPDPVPIPLSFFPAIPPAPLLMPPQVVDTSATESDRTEIAPRSGDTRTIIIMGYAPPSPGPVQNAPWLVPTPSFLPATPPAPAILPPAVVSQPVAATPPAQPTVVVIREPASESPRNAASEPARGVTVGSDAIVGIAIGVAGLALGYAGWHRRPVTPPAPLPESTPVPEPTPVAAPVPSVVPPPDSLMLLGEFNAGEPPTTAEKFDVGQSYEIEQQDKKKAEAQNQTALLEFILSQNLALHDDLADPDATLPEAMEVNPDLDRYAPRLDIV